MQKVLSIGLPDGYYVCSLGGKRLYKAVGDHPSKESEELRTLINKFEALETTLAETETWLIRFLQYANTNFVDSLHVETAKTLLNKIKDTK